MINKKQEKELSLEMIRHILGSIDLSDVQEEPELSETERREYCASIFAIFPRIEKDIKRMLYLQLLFANDNAGDWSQVLMSRGTCNGFYLLLEKWKTAASEHEAKAIEENEDKKFNKNNPILEYENKS